MYEQDRVARISKRALNLGLFPTLSRQTQARWAGIRLVSFEDTPFLRHLLRHIGLALV